MHILAFLTLTAFGLIVAALAVYLIAIAVVLRRTLFTLGTINVGLRAIAARVEPLEPILTEINSDLAGVRDSLNAVLSKKGAAV
jgi:hypothetical protein